jgi:hypothetical protein
VAAASGFVEGLVPLADDSGESLAIFGSTSSATASTKADPTQAVEVPGRSGVRQPTDSVALGRKFAQASGLGFDGHLEVTPRTGSGP